MAEDTEGMLRFRRGRIQPEAFTGEAPRPAAGDLEDEEERKKEKPLPRFNMHSVFWILSSIAVTYYVEFFSTIKTDYRIEGHLATDN
ncbi:transmembrane protein 128 [Heptranchias perlo]|uniref:transmembrane protein 128 n=1 Tax=Heptranchias perlo TaxID=212740 RepID=UPI00355A429B